MFIKQAVSLVGLGLLLYAIVIFDKDVPFPSVYALVPVVGTVLLILFAESKTLVGRLLSLRALVGIGLVSYSAYLWHQPLFVFARISSYEELSAMTLLGLSVAAFILAFISWRWVEKPFRNRNWLSQKQVLWAAFACSLILIALGSGLILGDGFSDRF